MQWNKKLNPPKRRATTIDTYTSKQFAEIYQALREFKAELGLLLRDPFKKANFHEKEKGYRIYFYSMAARINRLVGMPLLLRYLELAFQQQGKRQPFKTDPKSHSCKFESLGSPACGSCVELSISQCCERVLAKEILRW